MSDKPTEKTAETIVEEVKKVEAGKEYKLVEVPTGSQVAFQTPNEDLITSDQALIELLNKCDKILEAIA